MATMTMAQALASGSAGIAVVDTLANIVAGVNQARAGGTVQSLLARVDSFSMNGRGAESPQNALLLVSTLGVKFSRNGFDLVIRGSIAELTDAQYADGVALGTLLAAYDTAANLIAAASLPIATQLSSSALAANADVSFAGFLTLIGYAGFSIAPKELTLADSAANLLAYNASTTKRGAVKHFKIVDDSTVGIAQATTLAGMQDFSVAPGATLLVAADTASVIASGATLASLSSVPRLVVEADGDLPALLAASSALIALRTSVPSLRTRMTENHTATANEAADAASLPGFAAAPGVMLTVADTMQALLAMAPSARAPVGSFELASTTPATVAQANALAALAGFHLGLGIALTLEGSLAEFATLTPAAAAVASSLGIFDTVAHLIAASELPANTAMVQAEVDDGTYTIAQAQALLALIGNRTFTLVGTDANPRMRIVDTIAHMNAHPEVLTNLEAHGPVTAQPSDIAGTVDVAGALALLATPGFDPGLYDIAVADSAANLMAAVGQILGHGFQTVTVLSGTFAGTLADLRDPALTLAPGATVHLTTGGNVTGHEAARLATFAGLVRDQATPLTLVDTVAGAVEGVAAGPILTTVEITDGGSVTALQATVLAELRTAVGVAHFVNLGGLFIEADTAENLLDPAHAAGHAIVDGIILSAPATLAADQIRALFALPSFSAAPEARITLRDTATHVLAAGDLVQRLAAIDITDGGSISAAQAIALVQDRASVGADHFTLSGGRLTITDTAQALAGLTQWGDLTSIAGGSVLSQDATLTADQAAHLAGVPNLSRGGHTVTLSGTPAEVAGAAAAVGILTDIHVTATTMATLVQAATLAAMRAAVGADHFSLAGALIVAGSAAELLDNTYAAGRALASGYLLTGSVNLVTPQQATALLALPNFSVDNGADLRLHASIAQVTAAPVLDSGVSSFAITDGTNIDAATGAALVAAIGNKTVVFDNPIVLIDSASSLAAHPAALSLPITITLNASAIITAAEASSLAASGHFSPGNRTLIILDTAPNLAAMAASHADQINTWRATELMSDTATLSWAQVSDLALLSHFVGGGTSLTIQDQASVLAAHAANALMQGAATVLLSQPATLDAHDANLLATIAHFSLGNATLTVADTPAGMAALSDQAAARSTAQQLVAQTQQNAAGFTIDAHALTVLMGLPALDLTGFAAQISLSDTADHLADIAPFFGNVAIGSLQSFIFPRLSANAATTATVATTITQLPFFDANGHTLTVVGEAADLAGMNQATSALVTAVQVAHDAVITVAQANALALLSNFSTGGHQLVISDTAGHLAAFSPAGATFAAQYTSMTTLSADATVDPLVATVLAGLHAFGLGGHHLTVTGDTTQLVRQDRAAGMALATSIVLAANGSAGVADADTLASFGSRFSLGGHTLTVTGTAAELLDGGHRAGLAEATAVGLGSSPVTVDAATAAALAGLAGFQIGSTVLTVSDTAAHLVDPAYAPGLALAAHIRLSQAATVKLLDGLSLLGLPQFEPTAGGTLSIADTLHTLIHHLAQSAQNNALLTNAGTQVGLSENATATVAQLNALAAAPVFTDGLFTSNGHGITVLDSAAHIAGFTSSNLWTGLAYVVAGDAVLTAAQATVLAARNADTSGSDIIVADTVTNLLDPAYAAGRALATSLTLSADQTVTASVAAALFATPGFNPGSHRLTVADTAVGLTGMAPALKTWADAFILTDNAPVTVAMLQDMGALGSRFSLDAGVTLTVRDTAIQLARLQTRDTAFTTTQLLLQSETVTVAIAEALATLPAFTVPLTATLTVAGTVAQLTTLSQPVTNMIQGLSGRIVTTLTDGTTVTLSVADALALAAVPGFTHGNATITVSDTFAHLTAQAGWVAIADHHVVVDSIHNIVANAAASLMTSAQSIMPSGDSVIDATDAAVLNGLAQFTAGTIHLTVVDHAAAIAANVGAIERVASAAQLIDSAPVTAAQAQALSLLTVTLTIPVGQNLVVQDTYAHLSDANNQAGVALATRVVVQDTLANALTAVAHTWPTGVHPFYVLTAGGTMQTSSAQALAALGGSFDRAGFAIAVQGTAAAILGVGGAINTIGATAEVVDAASGIAANLVALLALGTALTTVSLTDIQPVSAQIAASVAGLVDKLAQGQALSVADTAANVSTYLDNLLALGAHLAAVDVTDTGANVTAQVDTQDGIEALGGLLTIHLTGNTALTAAQAVKLWTVHTNLAPGTTFTLQDGAGPIADAMTTLRQFSTAVLTAVTLANYTVDGPTAIALFDVGGRLTGHLAVDTSATFAANNAIMLGELLQAGAVAVISIGDATAAEVAANASALINLSNHAPQNAGAVVHVGIADTAAGVVADLAGLNALNGNSHLEVEYIHLTDVGTPTLTLTVAQLTSSAATVAHITTSFNLDIADTAANIQANLAAANSLLASMHGTIRAVTVTDAGTITLPAARLLAGGVDDGATSVLAKLAGAAGVVASGVAVADIAGLSPLTVKPQLQVHDTAAHLAADLGTNGSAIMGYLAGGTIGAVAIDTTNDPTDVVNLPLARWTAINGNAGQAAVLNLLGSAHLGVQEEISIQSLHNLMNATASPGLVTLDTTGTAIQNDLASQAPDLLAWRTRISAIHVADQTVITLTVAQALAAHVNDDATSVIAKISAVGGLAPAFDLVVTNVALSDLAALVAGYREPSMHVVGSGAAISGALVPGNNSLLVQHIDSIVEITLTDAQNPTLTIPIGNLGDLAVHLVLTTGIVTNAAQVRLLVTGVTVDDLMNTVDTATAGMPFILKLAVSDDVTNIRVDLAGNTSAIVQHLSQIASIDTQGNTVRLTAGQYLALGNDGAGVATLLGASLEVGGLTVAEMSAMVDDGVVGPTKVTISDTMAHIQADLADANSDMLAQRAAVVSFASTTTHVLHLDASRVLATGMDDSASAVLALYDTGGGPALELVAENATVAQVGSLATGLVVAPTINVVDHGTALSANLQGAQSSVFAARNVIGTIDVIDGTLDVSATNLLDTTWQALLAKVTSLGQVLRSTQTTVAQITAVLALDNSLLPNEIAVSDTAANLQADLDNYANVATPSVVLAHLAGAHAITAISATGGTLHLSMAQLQALGMDDSAQSVVHLLGGAVQAVGLTIADLGDLHLLDTVPQSLTINDTGANLSTDLTTGGAMMARRAQIDSITVINSGAITMTLAEAMVAHVNDGAGSLISRIAGPFALSLTGLVVADLNAALPSLVRQPDLIGISDTGAHLGADLASGTSELVAHHAIIYGVAAIVQTDNVAFTLTMARVQAADVLGLLGSVNNLHLHITGAAVADVTSGVQNLAGSIEIDVSDTNAALQADLASNQSKLVALFADGRLGTVAGAAGTITLTYAQFTANGTDYSQAGSIFGHITGASITVTGVAANQIATVLGLAVPPAFIEVTDATANIIAASAALQTYDAQISAVKPTETSLALADAKDLWDAVAGAGITLDESGLTIDCPIADLNTLRQFDSYTDLLVNAAHVHINETTVSEDVAHTNLLTQIPNLSLTQGHTFTLEGTSATATDLLVTATVATLALATEVLQTVNATVSAAGATTLAGMHGFTVDNGVTLTVSDTMAQLLDGANAAGIAVAGATSLTADATATVTQAIALVALPAFTDGGHLTIAGSVADVSGMAQGVRDAATHIVVTDTSAHVLAALGALQALANGLPNGHDFAITLTDGTTNPPSIAIDVATYDADRAAVDAITQAGMVKVSGGAAAVATDATALHNDTRVGRVEVHDSAQNVLTNKTALGSIGAKLAVVDVTDGVISAATAASLAALTNVSISGSFHIEDSASLIASAMSGSNQAAVLAFMNAHGVTLNAPSNVFALQASYLSQLTSLNKNGQALNVWDQAGNLISYAATVGGANIDAVYLSAPLNAVTLSPGNAATLFNIPRFNKNNPDNTTNAVTVQGTAALLDANFATLSTHVADASFVVTGANTILDAVLAHLQTLQATRANGATVVVRDAAATIANNAIAQTTGQTIVPTTWMLSGSGSVTAAQAAVLGGLNNFTAGAFVVTLSASASGLTVGNANAIANLGAAFALGGRTLGIAGDVATLSTLSAGAKSIVTPAITDTFAHIAAMTVNDNLLGGTITITDSTNVTTTQVAGFLALLKVGNGAGIPIANVTFPQAGEAVTDTLADIQALTGSNGWTQNPVAQSHFSLTVADDVAVLALGGNRTALAAMHATTFRSDQTTDAQTAENLAVAASAIHFSMGAFNLTVQDTAANLLAPGYTEGLDLATIWTLAADDTTDAAGGEALLGSAKFQLPNFTLTIADTSDSLLDGVLGTVVANSPYNGSVIVTLSASETLLAERAKELVALPDFADPNGFLHIRDSSTYLLDANNLAAEQAAASVELAINETLSVSTITSLEALPHFSVGTATIYLSGDDFASAGQLDAVIDLGTAVNANGHTITMTQNSAQIMGHDLVGLANIAPHLLPNGHTLTLIQDGSLTGNQAAALGDLGSAFLINGHTLTLTQDGSVNAAQLTTLADWGSGLNLNNHILTLTADASVNEAELTALANWGPGLAVGNHTVTLTQDALHLTPTQWNTLQNDNIVANGHLYGATPANVVASYDAQNDEVDITGDAQGGATIKVYSFAAPNTPGSIVLGAGSVSSFNTGFDHNIWGDGLIVTSSKAGTGESAPVVVMERDLLADEVANANATFAGTGAIEVDTGQFIDLVTSTTLPANPTHPTLVYNPNTYTLTLAIDNATHVDLVTLGTTSHPASLDASEIIIHHFA